MKMPCVWDGSAYTRRLHPISCTISLTLRPVSTVNMVLPPMDEINNFDWVEVPTPDGETQYYMVSSVSTDTETGEKTVMLEHGACTLDSQIIEQPPRARKTVSKKDTIENIVAFILQNQERWTVGTIESTDTIYVELGGCSLMTALLSIMDSIPDYQMEFVQSNANNWHIDIKARPTVPICEGRLNRNLVSCEISYDAGSVCTRVYGDLPNGHMDSTNINVYGLHEESISLNDGLSTEQKQRIAQAYLNQHDHPAIGVNISGLELSQITGLAIDRFIPGTMCRIVIPWLGVVENEVIVEKRYSDPYNAPEQVSISLANVVPDLSIAIAAVTGGGGGKNGGGIAGRANRYNTKFDQTDKYFRLIATETEWDTMGNGHLTGYGQFVLTHDSFQLVLDTVGEGTIEGGDGKITPASICGSINESGSEIAIMADHIKLEGSDIQLSTKIQVSNNIVRATGFDIMESARGEFNELIANVRLYANDVETDGLYVAIGGGYQGATWQTKEVVTGLNVTMPSISLTASHDIVFEKADGTYAKMTSVRAVQSYSDGNVTPIKENIYYLGTGSLPESGDNDE